MLSQDEKQNLLGPLVVGSGLGLLASVGVLGFVSEYGAHVYASSTWGLTTIALINAVLAFVCVVVPPSCSLAFFLLRCHVSSRGSIALVAAMPNPAVNTDAHRRGFARAVVAGYLDR